MSDPARYLGLNELVQEVCDALHQARLRKGYPSQAALIEAVVLVVEDVLKSRLDPLRLEHRIWQGAAELDGLGIQPIYAYGSTFIPDLVVEVSSNPTLAFTIRQLRADPSRQLRASIGEAVIYSRQFPAVIALLHGLRGQETNSLLDRAISDSLWSAHKIRLLFP